jgi:hypothetical protein
LTEEPVCGVQPGAALATGSFPGCPGPLALAVAERRASAWKRPKWCCWSAA